MLLLLWNSVVITDPPEPPVIEVVGGYQYQRNEIDFRDFEEEELLVAYAVMEML